MDLSKVKLRKTETKETKAPSVVLCATSEDYSRLMAETYIEQYIIKPWTFKSEFVTLTKEALSSLHHFFIMFQHDPLSRPLFRDDPHLILLANQVDAAKKEMKVEGVFVRLSSRSPKDAALLQPSFPSFFEKENQKVKEENEKVLALDPSLVPTNDINNKLHALYRASTIILQVNDGLSAIDLLITSKRIQGDIEQAINSPEPFNVVVREFVYFDVKYEFRGFVYGKKLTGLTQYNELVYFPTLSLQKDKILTSIASFFTNELLPKLTTLHNYVIDFILVENDIVELNPFAEFAGGGLFSWVTDLDTLMGKKDFEFRIVTEPASTHTIKTIYNDFSKFL